jgi:hypothetical protein
MHLLAVTILQKTFVVVVVVVLVVMLANVLPVVC